MTFEANPTGFLDRSLKSMTDVETQRPWTAGCARKAARGSVAPGPKQEIVLWGKAQQGDGGEGRAMWLGQ